jgi:hypothetical protein
MNNLDKIKLSIDEIEKQAIFGGVMAAGRGVANLGRRLAPKVMKAPAAQSAGGAAASAQRSGLVRSTLPVGASVAAPMVFKGGSVKTAFIAPVLKAALPIAGAIALPKIFKGAKNPLPP